MELEPEEAPVPSVSADDLERARDERIGWCPTCGEFCVPDVGPDDFGVAHECETARACGWRHAVRQGFVIPTEKIDLGATYNEEMTA